MRSDTCFHHPGNATQKQREPGYFCRTPASSVFIRLRVISAPEGPGGWTAGGLESAARGKSEPREKDKECDTPISIRDRNFLVPAPALSLPSEIRSGKLIVADKMTPTV
ncbi:hypothetical protein GWI33_011995 [Rhynchophorus ferrugineus]|uniref:Uncharacterized protein n=1 Tax=Rhynchophorus ferrugineus TaxID=354439 RepID=A0A834IPV9_RHYFE|nr:hypothetical protein GWI33_011995 [Rhynchophorus ferrugineus]